VFPIKLTGAQILFKVLEEEKVEVIFGYPGGAVLDIYDELCRHENIRHVLVRHEQAAVHAADGYARASGKVGVCFVTSGPGATNTVTGIATAYMDSIPIVVFTGQVPTRLVGSDAFQEVDIVGITRSCTKHNYLVTDVNELARIVKEAFYIARTGRPGPVLVDIPKDIQQAIAKYEPIKEVKLRSYKPVYKPNVKQLQRAISLIKKAKRPLILSGGGVVHARAHEELREFAEKMKSPVASTLMGLGSFPPDSPLWLGMVGMHGTYAANMATGECDLLIGIGVRFDDRVTGKVDTFAPNAKIIHIDIDPTSIQKNVLVTVPVVGDCKITLSMLNKMLTEDGIDEKELEEIRRDWLLQIEDWKKSKPLRYEQKEGEIKPQYVIEVLYELTKGDAIIATEVGQNQMWAAQFYKFHRPGQLLTSGGLGCMGYGFPAAIGAKVACPEKTVVDIAGDGSIQMNIQELATAIQNNIHVKVIILNNSYLGMVRQWQELFYERRYTCTYLSYAPDFVKLADAYGAVGLRIEKPEEVRPVLEKALSIPNVVFVDVRIPPEENVYPMVPAGSPITEMILV